MPKDKFVIKRCNEDGEAKGTVFVGTKEEAEQWLYELKMEYGVDEDELVYEYSIFYNEKQLELGVSKPVIDME